MVFVRNLLDAYQRKGTSDPAAYERLLRNSWYHDGQLRSRFFELLARTNRLDSELRTLQALPKNVAERPAVQELLAEGQAWQSHFELAAPALQTVAEVYPADESLTQRTALALRSLGDTDAAVRISERQLRLSPRDTEALARIGDIWGEKERFALARPYWNRMAEVEPGKPEGYLEAATVYWDYYLYDDALRMIGEGRQKLGNPDLFAFEAGAIYEGKRQFSNAIAEYARGAMESLDSPARRRLMWLASRPEFRAAVDEATLKLASGQNPDPAAFALRTAVLEEDQRRDDLSKYLLQVIGSTRSLDLLAKAEEAAERQGLDDVKGKAIERQIALSSDPVERVKLRLAAARFAESRNDLQRAGRLFESVYEDNSRALGVVRATVDFFWRAKEPKHAIDVLEQSAGRANVTLRRKFLTEAAAKAIESGDLPRARKIVDPLLASEPAAADLIALKADTYARAGDDAGLRTFYASKLAEIREPEARSALRRSLVPVLTRLKDYSGGIDQYIELLNRYGDDAGLLAEAAGYARAHSVTDRLVAYYVKASADSPRDARWPTILARLQTHFEDLPAAVASYAKAAAIRPDRTDLLIAKGALEERLMRWEASAATYAKLYELAYHDPQWMVKAAEANARLKRPEETLKALRTAFIDGRAARAEEYLEMARLLDKWNMLAEAQQYADEGLKRLPADAMDATVVRIATRRRQYQQVMESLGARLNDGNRLQMWTEAANVARTYYTPEEKAAFAAHLEKALPGQASVAMAAGLADLAARQLAGNPQQLIDFEQSRLRFAQAAQQLERLWKASPADDENRNQKLAQAAENYRLAGQRQNELRVLTQLDQLGAAVGPIAVRYGELLRAAAPERLVQLARAGATPELRNTAAQTAFGGDASLALRAVAARGAGLPPVWTKAYTGLTDLYFARTTPEADTAFAEALGARTIGEQAAAKADRTQQLVGDPWFYYGARYGEFLALRKDQSSEELLMAEVEDRPASAALYVQLGNTYRDQGFPEKALEQYARSLQIDPKRAGAHQRVAGIYAQSGDMDRARGEWQAALRAFAEMQEEARLPETFWTGLSETLSAIASQKQLPQLRPDADKLLRTYIRRNGRYRIEEILSPLMAAADPAESVRWIADLSRAAKDPVDFLSGLVDDQWIPGGQRTFLYARLTELAQQEVERTFGEGRRAAEYRRRELQLQFIRALIDGKQFARAKTLLEALSESDRKELQYSNLPQLEIAAAAGTNTLDKLLGSYSAQRDRAPTNEKLRQAADSLRSEGNSAAARRVLEYVYTREIEQRNFTAANFLGLAEVRLEAGDAAGATAAIRRMVVVGEEPYESLTAAADLLDRFGKKQDAIAFREARVQAAPWDFEAVIALAKARQDTSTLRAAVAQSEAPYAARAEGAMALSGASGLGSAELDLLVSGQTIPAGAAEKPYFFYARVRAAEQTSDTNISLRLLRGTIEIDPDSKPVRIAFFRAASAAGRPQLMAGTFQSSFGNTSVRSHLNETEPPRNISRYTVDDFLRSWNLTDTERARIAVELGRAYRKLNQPSPAAFLLRLAEKLDGAVNVKPELEALAAELSLEQENASRMPQISEALEQPRKVRPRLVAGVRP